MAAGFAHWKLLPLGKKRFLQIFHKYLKKVDDKAAHMADLTKQTIFFLNLSQFQRNKINSIPTHLFIYLFVILFLKFHYLANLFLAVFIFVWEEDKSGLFAKT